MKNLIPRSLIEKVAPSVIREVRNGIIAHNKNGNKNKNKPAQKIPSVSNLKPMIPKGLIKQEEKKIKSMVNGL
jgi:hypothetical protein